jgi:hypothetical protein
MWAETVTGLAMGYASASACRTANGAAGFSLAASAMLEFWRTLRKDLFDPYRPEVHYMRGPGPKWRQKHARADRFDDRPGIAHLRTQSDEGTRTVLPG